MTFYSESQIKELYERSRQLRLDCLEMIHRRQAGHPGGSLSAADIVAVLFFCKMKIDPKRPDWPERDRFILSKGHASALLYAALSRRGYFPIEDCKRWGELDCHLQGHPDRLKTPGVDMTAGILGHGVAIAAGLALAARYDQMKYHTYTLLGDGECQAGVVWEGAMLASKNRLANMTAIVDYNDVQLDGAVHDIMPLEPLAEKWKSFNWEVIEINGHDIQQILAAIDLAHEIHNRPAVIIAHTTKGKGVSFMENRSQWHGVPPSDEQYEQAVRELKSGAKEG
jgi:transketolase